MADLSDREMEIMIQLQAAILCAVEDESKLDRIEDLLSQFIKEVKEDKK